MKRFCDHSCLLTRTTGNKVAATRPVLVESILIDFVQQIFIKTFNLKVVAISNLVAECIEVVKPRSCDRGSLFLEYLRSDVE